MRRIKFRGISKKSEKFIYGCLFTSIHPKTKKRVSFIFRDYDDYTTASDVEVIPDAVGQYVGQYEGQRDKNKKEIYEGDILKAQDKKTKNIYNQEVYYDDETLGFFVKDVDGSWYIDVDDEIIGNIYENRELIETLS